MTRAEIDLSDAGNPRFDVSPSGGLFDATRALRGTEAVRFKASDSGGGVASVRVLVDGVERDRRIVDDNGGGCAQPYTLRVPCPNSVSADYGFDTTQLADGAHSVALVVRDATEVNQVTYGPVPVTVDNRPLAVPESPASSGGLGGLAGSTPVQLPTGPLDVGLPAVGAPARGTGEVPAATGAVFAKAGTARTVAHGSSTVIRGRLVDGAGRPVANARLDVLAKVRLPHARTRVVGHTATSATGAYAYRLAAGPSRDVTIGYRSRSTDSRYAATQRLSVFVRAGVRLSRSAASLRNGDVLTLSARVLGPNVGRRATTVAFQVKIGSLWRTFGTGSIDSHGIARVKHRFRYTTSAVTYLFRAKTSRSSALPYTIGTSPVTGVRVRP